MNANLKFKFVLKLAIVWLITTPAIAQQGEPLTLQKAIDLALQNNHLLNAKKWQVEEKRAQVKESEIKKYPSVSVSSTYQYNANLGALVIPQGSFGSLPLSAENVVALPNADKTFVLGNHHTFNVGATVYQPVSQLGKIRTGIDLAKTDVRMAEMEKEKAALRIRQTVEKVYYGLLITRKQKEEAQAKLDLAHLKLYDVESALLSGKTVDAGKVGLQANIADEEQNLLKLTIQAEDYTADLKQLTGILTPSFIPEDVMPAVQTSHSVEEAKTIATTHNVNLKIATLGQIKTELAIKAAKLSYRPDVGLIAGYTYQTGNVLYPANNPFAGVSFKWNIQDLVANKQVLNQRGFLLQQARENVANTQEQVTNDIEKAYRKINQATALIAVAEKAVNYRTQELKIQNDRKDAGLNTQADILTTKSLLAKAQADLYAAQLNYRLAQSDLKILTGE
ncbi:TolC family protein [Larkinella humicola]|uniref:TolC family protein n=1 Tax=Larkinella humicola TaxID=2607654 RepID=A0A5N1J1L2_9BACT|nr:TolC family protein [Larkinella humicola]KAA9340381.1 TolC family protein [Larkinella humicola]